VNKRNVELARKIVNRDLRKDNFVLREKLTFVVQSNQKNYEILQKFNDVGDRILKCADLRSLVLETSEMIRKEFAISAVTFCLDRRFEKYLGKQKVENGELNDALFERLFYMDREKLAEMRGASGLPILRGDLEHGSVDHFGFRLFRRVKSEAIVPLFHLGDNIGTLNLGCNTPSRYRSGTPVDFLTQMAKILSLTISIHELKSQLNDHVKNVN